MILTLGPPSNAMLWNIESGKVLWEISWESTYFPGTPNTTLVVYSKNGDSIAVYEQSVVRIIDANNGNIKQTIPGHPYGTSSISLLADGKTLATVSTQSGAIWDLESAKVLRKLNWSEAKSGINVAVILNRGKLMATGGRDKREGEVMVWDADSGQVTQTLRHSHPTHNGIDLIACSENGLLLAAALDSRSSEIDPVNIWDLKSGRMNWTLTDHPKKLECLAVSPDGSFAITGCYPMTMWRLHDPID